MTNIEGTTRDFEQQPLQVHPYEPLYENMSQAAAAVPVVFDYPLVGTVPVRSVAQEMVEGYQACAAMELEILKEFEAVDRENF